MKCHKIGETFWWHVDPDTNVLLKVVENDIGEICENCYFENHNRLPSVLCNNFEPCISHLRPDLKYVHFEEVI